MAKNKLKVLISETHNPWFNLATEDWIFRDMDPDYKILFLWRNQETVVVGRFQNPWVECNLKKMEGDNVLLTRRQSGGGAVFHDLGNTNFTFLTSRKDYDKSANNKIICNALERFNIKAYASGRNDIVVDDSEGPRKISGSAFKENRDRCFHHGTLLIDADLSKLQNYLNPNKKKLTSKGITSVRARVTNLNDIEEKISHKGLTEAIIHEFFKYYESECEIEILDDNYLKSIDKLNTYYEKLKDWNWRFGETPEFNHHMSEHFEWGTMDVHIDSHKGLITNARIFSDSLHPEMIEKLMAAFEGKKYSEKGVNQAVIEVKKELPMIGEYLDQFRAWLSSEV